MENLEFELTSVHVDLIENYELSLVKKAKEQKRKELVSNLITTIKNLSPEKSEALLKDLKKIGRSSDFNQFFFYQKSGFINICHYNGNELITIKENLEITVKNFSWKILSDKYNCDLKNFLGTETTEMVENSDGTISEAKTTFEHYKGLISENFGKKSAISIDVNLTNRVKRQLEIKGLSSVIKEQRKLVNKIAKKAK